MLACSTFNACGMADSSVPNMSSFLVARQPATPDLMGMPVLIIRHVLAHAAKTGFFTKKGNIQRLTVCRKWYKVALELLLGNEKNMPLNLTPDHPARLFRSCLQLPPDILAIKGYEPGELSLSCANILARTVRGLTIDIRPTPPPLQDHTVGVTFRFGKI